MTANLIAEPLAPVAPAMHSLAMEVQSRLQRVIEIARLIESESNHLSVDSEPNRFRICAEVIWEAAEAALADAEKIETTCAKHMEV